MALHFVSDDVTAAHPGDTVTLTGSEAKHAAVVRRLRVGEPVTVGDGAGVWLEGRAQEVAAQQVHILIENRTETRRPNPQITLVQALAKGDRAELAIQAACELGVDTIVPWQASRSISRWEGPKARKGHDRWSTIVREASKQAHRAWIPEVSPVTTLEQALSTTTGQVLVLDPTASERVSTVDLDGRNITLIVGPEGGITPEELALCEASGACPVRLGDTVLRTSTAGPAAIAVLSARLGRW
ncbi:16S rRNA (uracil(1498)-N(3))-methyltransferase [Microbacterium sp. YY-01]|uniref:16S rRNA (uracil(1498)-N(3))-methyltransferase n=1 Tax=Microbacterium sp. YY-01 TaxID=3421634 RepID=UPI003D16BE18